MTKKYRIWFSEINDEGIRQSRHYYTTDLKSAVLSLRVAIDELELIKEVYPSNFGLSEWSEAENDWLEWETEEGQDIREYIYTINIEEPTI
jgi:hypothetical protein